MFQLLATVLAIGATDPVIVLKNNHPFPTEEACKAYLDTDMGRLDKMKLDAVVTRAAEEAGAKYEVKFDCKAVGANGSI